jgi:uncharacterized membrane protein
MTTLAVTFYDVVKWLHVTAVVAGFGATFAFGIYMGVTAAKHPRSVPAVLEVQMLITRTLVTIGAVVILVTGLYLAADRWEFSDFFIAWGIVAILLLLGLAHGFFLPHDRRALAAANRDIQGTAGDQVEFSDEFNRTAAASARVGPIAGLIVILTIYVMVAKPFL